MPYKTKLSTKAKMKRVGYVVFFGVILMVMGAIVYMIIDPGLGPRGPVGAERVDLSPQERDALLEESEQLERRFNELTSGEATPGEEEIAILKEAYEKHRLATVNNPYADLSDQQRLERLRSLVVEYEGEYLGERVAALREEAEAERTAGSYLNAVTLLEEALEIQERINRELRQSPYSSTPLVSSLNREIVNLSAEPIIMRSREAEREARQAMREERWTDAIELFQEARGGQIRINTDFQRTAYTDRTRVTRLEEEIASLETRGASAEISALEEEGRALLEEGVFGAAAERFELAVERQTDLNRRFPGSRYASTATVRALEGARQTALSGVVAEELYEAVTRMEHHFRERQPDQALNFMVEADRQVRTIESEYPLSEFRDEDLALRIGYLMSIRNRLESVYDDVFENLAPIPGVDGLLLYRLETPQDLFTRIMNRNPSRNPGPSLPVDSVNREEAEEFCRRLSWVLARTVRLPTREEYVHAAGDISNLNPADSAWHLRNSGGESQPVGTLERNMHGFHDLLGNLAEWTGTAEGVRQAFVAGGSYDDDLQEIGEYPFRAIDVNQRSRTVGFRFLVEE